MVNLRKVSHVHARFQSDIHMLGLDPLIPCVVVRRPKRLLVFPLFAERELLAFRWSICPESGEERGASRCVPTTGTTSTTDHVDRR